MSYETYNAIKKIIEEKRQKKEALTNDEAGFILEEILDTLIEVGNGITDEDLHKSADDLIQFRDHWFVMKIGE